MVEPIVALDGLIDRRNQLPAVAKDEQPHDEDGDAGQLLLLGALVRSAAATASGMTTGHGQSDAPSLGSVAAIAARSRLARTRRVSGTIEMVMI